VTERRGSRPGAAPEDEDDAPDDQLTAMRAVWLSMRDEEPPSGGLDALLAAARTKAAELQPAPSWWQRVAAGLRRPPVFAFATALVLVAGAVIVEHNVKRSEPELASTTEAPASGRAPAPVQPPAADEARVGASPTMAGDDRAGASPTMAGDDRAGASPTMAGDDRAGASPTMTREDRAGAGPTMTREDRAGACATTAGEDRARASATMAGEDRAGASQTEADGDRAGASPTKTGEARHAGGGQASVEAERRVGAGPATTDREHRARASQATDTLLRAGVGQPVHEQPAPPVVAAPRPPEAGPRQEPAPVAPSPSRLAQDKPDEDVGSSRDRASSVRPQGAAAAESAPGTGAGGAAERRADPALYAQCEAAAERGDCAAVRRLADRIRAADPGYRARVRRDSAIARCLAR
jgi:hypothetical protein